MLIFRQMLNCEQNSLKARSIELFRTSSYERQRSPIRKAEFAGLGRPELMLVDAVAADLRFKCLARNSQLGDRTGRARDAAVALRQRRLGKPFGVRCRNRQVYRIWAGGIVLPRGVIRLTDATVSGLKSGAGYHEEQKMTSRTPVREAIG